MSIRDSLYRVESIPGKGRGIISNRPIAKGTVILSEPPFILQRSTYTQDDIAKSLSSKSKEDKRRYLGLMNCRGELPPLIGIFKTNVLPCGDHDAFTGQTADTGGIFLQGSLFNSSCVPNVNNCWDATTQAIVFRALRDIAEGEELCISYLNPLDTRDARRSKLREKFRFECHCAACSLSAAALELSDQRRARLKDLYDEIPRCVDKPRAGVTKVKLALRLLQEEGLFIYRHSFSYDAFQFCVAASDLPNAKAWITKAREDYVVASGNTETAQRYEEYWKNPKSHLAWGLNRRMQLGGPEI